ncbi:MAG: hypothetical protein EA390_06505 [Balneolaceae bacterium]|nr:MAG: hypothetical protein EA390_06505 [Balneolaceae bacterium]
MINSLAIGLALGLIGIGVIGILFSGVRNVINGKSEIKKVSIFLVPILVFVGSYLAMGTLNEAGVATMMFMMVVMILGIMITGTRGTFKF